MAPAAEAVGAACIRVDHEEFAGDVVAEIKDQIASAAAVIADASGSRPNVLFEMGYANGLRLPVIQICSTPLDELPFDIRNENTLRYVLGQVHELRKNLERRLRGVVV